MKSMFSSMKNITGIVCMTAAMAMMAPADSHAAMVSRLNLGPYNFYTASQDEALHVNAALGGNALYSLQYFRTYDTTQSFSTGEILRCYSPYKNVHAYVLRNWAGGSCAAFGFWDEGTIGRIRLRKNESVPVPGYGTPLYSMTRVVGQSPDGTNISIPFITTSPSEAAATCGNGWIWAMGASSINCFWGYAM